MHYDACFLLYRLQHPDDYEERTTVENVSFWATKPKTPNFVMRSNGKKTLNSTELETLKNRRKVGIFYTMGLNPTYWFQSGQMLWTPFLRPLGVYIEFKVKLQKQTNKKQEEKKEIEQENGRELSNDKLYTINLSRWRMETELEMGLETSPPPSLSI